MLSSDKGWDIYIESIINSIGTHWLALYVNGDNVTYCDSFGVEYIPKEMKKFIGNKNITTKIFIEHKPMIQ